MADIDGVLRFVADASAAGQETGLATIARVEGHSPREVGTTLAVSSDGRWVGSLSGGCIERAVAGEVIKSIKDGVATRLRLGAGSPMIDVRLPCGGAMELVITPNPDLKAVMTAIDLRAARIRMSLGFVGGRLVVAPADCHQRSEDMGRDLVAVYEPRLAIMILGNGVETERLALLAHQFGADVIVVTGEADLTERLAFLDARRIMTPASPISLSADMWTAIVFLFHDHDWEDVLLPQALNTEAFYVGAMGSAATQRRRIDALLAAGVRPDAITRLHGPIGSIPGAKDPDTLALSILAQVVSTLPTGIAAYDGPIEERALATA